MALPNIQIGDDLLQDALLASVEIVQELNQHWWCTVVCRQTEDKRIPVEDFLGKAVQIKTTDQEGVEHVNFAGFILDVELNYEVWGSYTAQLTAVSDSYRLDLTARKEYYAAQTLSSIANTVAGRDGLAVSVNAPASKALNYVQYGETDFSFINRIVDDYGAWMRPKQGGLEVYAAFQAGGSVEWRAEDGLIDFRIKGTLSPATFSGSHYDHHVMQSNTFSGVSTPAEFYPSSSRLTSAVQSQSQNLPSGFAPQRARVMTLDNYQESLQKESQRSIGGNITASGHSRNQQLMAGNTVDIQGSLEAKGTYGLIKVVHRWEPQGYSNSFTCTPWKNYRNPEQPALRSWYGVVPARVVEHNDPKKMGRLKVQFFWQADGATHWARMVSPHAGPDRGFMFMPEVGDEVAVMFEDGDPERPVILGSVWNGVQQAPRGGFFAPEADIPDNNVKRIVTKSGNRVQMVDTPEKESVVVATPNHTSMTMTEKHDSTGRTLVHIHSDGDIVLTAPNGRVHVQSLFFSREIGDASKKAEAAAAVPAAAPALAAAAPAAASQSWLGGFGKGLFDSTLKPLGHMIAHPIDTVEGIGTAIAHPINTGKALGHAISTTAKGVMSGDGNAMGTALGSVGMLFIPGADVAEGAEDAARVGQLGELGEASKVADVADASKVTDAAGLTEGAASSTIPEGNMGGELSSEAGQPIGPLESAVPSPIEQRVAANAELRASPQFQEDMAKSGVTQDQIDNMFAKQAPLGFESPEQFQNFKGDLNTALEQDGLQDAEVGMKGTATTFYSENPGKPLGHFWDADPANPGDYDLNLDSPTMVQKMNDQGIGLSQKYGIYSNNSLQSTFPSLQSFSQSWSETLGRDVNVVGLPSTPVRDPTEYILTGK